MTITEKQVQELIREFEQRQKAFDIRQSDANRAAVIEAQRMLHIIGIEV